MECKRKEMKRLNWLRILERRYTSQPIHCHKQYKGIMSLMMLDKVSSPLFVHYNNQDVLLADNHYQWLQVALEDQYFWVTAMFDQDDQLIQIYFDMTKGNHLEDKENPYFDDLFLDIVLPNKGDILIIDQDELEEALEEKIISIEEYHLAIKTANDLYQYLLMNRDKVVENMYHLHKQLKTSFSLNQ